MQINKLTAPYTSKNELIQTNLTEKSNNTSKDQITNTMNSKYDMTKLSSNELGMMVKELQETGVISDKEAIMLNMERMNLEQFGGVSADTKIDMIAYFKEIIDAMKSTPGSKGVEIVERSLDILQAVQAKSKAEIPAFV